MTLLWFDRIVLRRGTRGPAVAAVRRRLHRVGYDVTETNEPFDEALHRAVVAFQAHHQLTPDGVVGPATWHRLYDRETVGTGGRDTETAHTLALTSTAELPFESPFESPSQSPSPWAPTDPGCDTDRVIAIHVSIADRRLSLHTHDGNVSVFPAAVGRWCSPTPPGRYTVREKVPIPGEPLGARWIRLQPDICSIHGTAEPWTIGQAVTAGCIRLYNKDVEYVFHRLARGDVVLVE